MWSIPWFSYSSFCTCPEIQFVKVFEPQWAQNLSESQVFLHSGVSMAMCNPGTTYTHPSSHPSQVSGNLLAGIMELLPPQSTKHCPWNPGKKTRECCVPAGLPLWAVLSCPAPHSFSWEVLSTTREEEYSVLLWAVCSCSRWEAATAIPWIPVPCFRTLPWSPLSSGTCSRTGLWI